MPETQEYDVPLPLEIVWSRLSGQLTALAATTRGLEDVAAPHPPEAVTVQMIKTLQSFDYLGQALDDLAVLTAELGQCAKLGELAPVELSKVTSKLRLAASKDLLGCAGSDTSAPGQDEDPGEATLF